MTLTNIEFHDEIGNFCCLLSILLAFSPPWLLQESISLILVFNTLFKKAAVSSWNFDFHHSFVSIWVFQGTFYYRLLVFFCHLLLMTNDFFYKSDLTVLRPWEESQVSHNPRVSVDRVSSRIAHFLIIIISFCLFIQFIHSCMH